MIHGEFSSGGIGAIHQQLDVGRLPGLQGLREIGRNHDHGLDQTAVEPVLDLCVTLRRLTHDQILTVGQHRHVIPGMDTSIVVQQSDRYFFDIDRQCIGKDDHENDRN